MKPIGHIVEYWIHYSSGDVYRAEGKENRAVHRLIGEAEWKPSPKGEDWAMVYVERVEMYFYFRDNDGKPCGDFDNEYLELWKHPDWDEKIGGWEE